jgi:3-carboxy-cis,cis-muconate cycloisomerase
LIPAPAARSIASACDALQPSGEQLVGEARRSGSLAIPLVKALTDEVRKHDAAAAAFVHYGSTSQDILDSALVLCLKPCLEAADRVLGAAAAQFAAHARKHARTLMLGRTLMQPASPITAGLKIARWANSVGRCRSRLAAAANRALCVQLGGAVGALDSLGAKRSAVRAAVARRLGLADRPAWHTQRDALLALGAELAILIGTIGKIARDLALLSQAEIQEMQESPGGGGSTAMPHKRNPVACMQALAAAARAPGLLTTLLHAVDQEHERALGGWQAELATWPDLAEVAGGALDAIERIAAGLVVNPERMAGNLEATRGLVFSERLARHLAARMDRTAASIKVEEWCVQAVKDGHHLKLVASAALGEDLAQVFSVDALLADLQPALDEQLAEL